MTLVNDIEDIKSDENINKTIEECNKIHDILLCLDKYCNEYGNEYGNQNGNQNCSENGIKHDFSRYMLKLFRQNKVGIKKTDLILEYRKCLEKGILKQNILLEKMICKKPSRSISGITSITLVMSPYPNGQSFSCKHNCYYCPNEPAHEGNNWQAQPRSYLFNEPAVRRANQNNFKAYEQMIDRMDTLYKNGHTIDKLEIIIEGGTYTEYPVDYLEDFIRDIYYTANTYFDKHKRLKSGLDSEVYQNRFNKVHIIGVCIETRPDAIITDNNEWMHHFRRCGVTRIQLGVQSSHNHILKKLNRGHTIEQVVECMEYLKNNCFKIDIHIMPDLPFSTPELDKETFDYVYEVLQPDQMKIYPCAVTPWTIIEKWYKDGKWKPYTEEELMSVMNYAMEKCPDWIRLPRVIRDIPLEYIQAGNNVSNLRQSLSDGREIRGREIERHLEYYEKPAKIFVQKIGKKDYFISYESYDKKALFGFIRLRLPDKIGTNSENKTTNCIFPVLNNKALIRELHVYGYNTAVGTNAKSSQHKGIGSKLLRKAEHIALWNYYTGIAVISGEGVKEYYSKKGYVEEDTYMTKNIVSLDNYKQFLYSSVITIIFIQYLLNIYLI